MFINTEKAFIEKYDDAFAKKTTEKCLPTSGNKNYIKKSLVYRKYNSMNIRIHIISIQIQLFR